MTPCFVGFDTSNYTTSVAVCTAEGDVVANVKIPLPVKEGQRGLRQSDAVFEHVRNLPTLMARLQAFLAEGEYCPLAVGVSTKPRDAEGSYMPCFLSGKAAASAFSAARNLPIYEFSHQNGHLMAALYSCRRTDLLSTERFFAFHVSGGTTEAPLVEPKDGTFSVTLVGETDDIMVIENGGVIIRTPVSAINVYKRDVQGVIVMRIEEGNKVVSIERVENMEQEEA